MCIGNKSCWSFCVYFGALLFKKGWFFTSTKKNDILFYDQNHKNGLKSISKCSFNALHHKKKPHATFSRTKFFLYFKATVVKPIPLKSRRVHTNRYHELSSFWWKNSYFENVCEQINHWCTTKSTKKKYFISFATCWVTCMTVITNLHRIFEIVIIYTHCKKNLHTICASLNEHDRKKFIKNYIIFVMGLKIKSCAQTRKKKMKTIFVF